ncbi:MAG: hypothetical protein AAGG01_13135 [Planctomycetota bacterium]
MGRLRWIRPLAAVSLVGLTGCSTLLDSVTSLDETIAVQGALLEEVRTALVDPDGGTLPGQLGRTEGAITRLAGGAENGRSLADLAASLEETTTAVYGVKATLEGVLGNTESLVWHEGSVPPGEVVGGSILAGVHRSTSKIAAIVPGQELLQEGRRLGLAGVLGVLLGLLFGLLLSRLLRGERR